MKALEEKITNRIEPIIQTLGYELYDIEYVKQGKEYHLIIYITKEGGIGIEDCEKVNNAITDELDKADYIKEQYYLEVSSTGIEKVLRKDKHFKDSIGIKVEVNLYTKIENEKQYIGILKGFNEKELTLITEQGEKTIDRKNISQVKQVYEWN